MVREVLQHGSILTSSMYFLIPNTLRSICSSSGKKCIVKKIIGDEERITCRPADKIEPELDKLREAIKEYIVQDEDVLTYALFEQVALKFFENRKAKMLKTDPNLKNQELKTHPVL
ncbi:MAG: hypothetical protein IKJ06_06005 [Clostridia bacterium]|nr:hypothetical protein [Clostridia bacterium]